MDSVTLNHGKSKRSDGADGTSICIRISIFGLGYVGAVSTGCFADRQHTVVGVDPDGEMVKKMSSGYSPIKEPGLDDLLEKGVRKGFVYATTDVGAAIHATDVSLICVGIPSASDGSCDLKYLRRLSAEIGAALAKKKSYHVVVFRSTVPPGTTRKVMLPILEEASGKKAGVDFGLAFHPEFLRESTAIDDFFDPPKTIIGGIDMRSRQVVAALYRGIDDQVIEINLEAAEMVKYVDNTWHALKVSFANEVGRICQASSVDSHEVMDIFVRDTKLNISPYYMKPGFAFGGSCLPKDVRGINHLARELGVLTPVLDSIIASNTAQISHALEMIKATKPNSVAFLGITFKAAMDDLRESPILPVIDGLLGEGIEVKIYDPNLKVKASIGHHALHSKYGRGDIADLMKALPSLMKDSVGSACKDVDTIVISLRTDLFRHMISSRKPDQRIIDLVHIFDGARGWPEMAGAGMDDYIQKPANDEQLNKKIRLWSKGDDKGIRNILVAEDEIANAAVIKAKLLKSGHQVRIVNNGLEAVRAVQSEKFDLVFMDVSMPEMNGKEATARIRALTNDHAAVPIIALTAHAAPEQSDTYTGICW